MGCPPVKNKPFPINLSSSSPSAFMHIPPAWDTQSPQWQTPTHSSKFNSACACCHWSTRVRHIALVSCSQGTVHIFQSSSSDWIAITFLSSSPCEGLKGIFLSSIYLFVEWKKEENEEEKPLLHTEAPDLLPAGHHLFLPHLDEHPRFGTQTNWLQTIPVTLCEPEEPSQLDQ